MTDACIVDDDDDGSVLVLSLYRVFPYAGIQFMTFDKAKAYILKMKGEPDGQLSNVESLLAGSFAGRC